MPTPQELYLDLLKRVLTRSGFGEGYQASMRTGLWPRVATWACGKAGLVAVEPRRSDPAAREEGRDWPVDAETMVGVRRLDNLQQCVESALADGVPGDLVETGVWRGGASIFMKGVLAAHGDTRRNVWLADSFQGLPPPREDRYPADKGDLQHTHAFLRVSEDQVRDNFRRYGLLDDRVRFLKGWFKDTLPTAPIGPIAVLRLDGDLYESTMDALTSLYPKVSPGGYCIVDDYGAISACKAAVENYRKAHGITAPMVQVDWTGVYWRVPATTPTRTSPGS